MTLLAAHQPDFLPYSGFFWKVMKADLFDLAIWDQFSMSGYHRRALMNDEWVSLKLHRKSSAGLPLNDVVFDPKESQQRVLNGLRDFYGQEPYVADVEWMIVEAFEELELDENGEANLVELNVGLIKKVCAWLAIDTPLVIAKPLTKPKAEGIVELCEFYGADSYLSGIGAAAYIGDEFEQAGIRLEWAAHKPVSGNSIVDALCKTSEPLEWVDR